MHTKLALLALLVPLAISTPIPGLVSTLDQLLHPNQGLKPRQLPGGLGGQLGSLGG